MSIIGLQDHYRPSSRFTHSKKRKIAQHPDVGSLVVAMADGSDDSDDDVPLGLLLRQPQYGVSHLSRSSDDNDSGGAAEGGHVDVDDAAAGGHVDVDGGGDDFRPQPWDSLRKADVAPMLRLRWARDGSKRASASRPGK